MGYLSSYFNANTALEDVTTGDSPWIAVNSTVPSLGIRKAYGYALGIALMSLIGAFLDAHALLLADKLGMMSRILLTGAIYQKVLSLSQVTVGRVTIGRIVNLASNDVQRLDLVIHDVCMIINDNYISQFHRFLPSFIFSGLLPFT